MAHRRLLLRILSQTCDLARVRNSSWTVLCFTRSMRQSPSSTPAFSVIMPVSPSSSRYFVRTLRTLSLPRFLTVTYNAVPARLFFATQSSPSREQQQLQKQQTIQNSTAQFQACEHQKGEQKRQQTEQALRTPKCRVYDMRDVCVPYRHGWDLQHALCDELKSDVHASDAVLLLQHSPVYTLGTASRIDNVLFPCSEIPRLSSSSSSSSSTPNTTMTEKDAAEIVRTERGGEVTFHGPGQLVVYPILNLKRHKADLHWYLRSLEDSVIHMLRDAPYNLGDQAGRKEGLTGVWVNDRKVCAMGLKVSKWITMHGLAINIDMDLSPFNRIIPCGIHEFAVTSLYDIVIANATTSTTTQLQHGTGQQFQQQDITNEYVEHHDINVTTAADNWLSAFDRVFGPYDFVNADVNALQRRVTETKENTT